MGPGWALASYAGPSCRLFLVLRKSGLLFFPPGRPPNSGTQLLDWVGSGVSQWGWGEQPAGVPWPEKEERLSCLVACNSLIPVGFVKSTLWQGSEALCLQCCGPVNGSALSFWTLSLEPGAQRSLCPAPQYYYISLLGVAETGMLAGNWHHSAFPAMPASIASARHSGSGIGPR